MRALLIRDLQLALRAGGGFGLGLAFFLIVVVLVPFSVGPASSLLVSVSLRAALVRPRVQEHCGDIQSRVHAGPEEDRDVCPKHRVQQKAIPSCESAHPRAQDHSQHL